MLESQRLRPVGYIITDDGECIFIHNKLSKLKLFILRLFFKWDCQMFDQYGVDG